MEKGGCGGTYLGMHTEWKRPWCLSTCISSGAVLKAPIMLNMANMVFQITNSPRSSYLEGRGIRRRQEVLLQSGQCNGMVII